ncbi:hypothetical protein O3P69_010453 [Scylla paramamosain]|uniref:Restriction endonuclease n=1 Tax=Scylla paramamosain TaxID=85552 RepID=A0AAW0TX41_SCYPA
MNSVKRVERKFVQERLKEEVINDFFNRYAKTDAHPPSYSSLSSFNTDNSNYCDFYENIIKVQEDPRSCLLPRFRASLSLDWRKILGNNGHLNLVPNPPNTDESGSLFETTRFISKCSELIVGKTRKRLKECITRVAKPAHRGGGGKLNTLEYNTDNLIEVCAKNGRFVDIENDPVFLYKFAAYNLEMLANNDQFFEDLTGIITESFDFNGVDTRNWNDFIEKHFLSVLLGRRAFLVSRPSACIKRMVGSSNDENSSVSVRRLAKLMMVKPVNANDLTLSDLVLCCIEDDKEDFVVRSAKEYQNTFYRLGKKILKEANAIESAMSGNACSNEQMSKKEEADLSYGLYTDTVEKAVIKPEQSGGAGAGGDGAGSGVGDGGVDDLPIVGECKHKSRQRNNQYRENNTKNFNGKTEDIYDHSNREDTSGTMSVFIAASNSMDGLVFMREKDVKFRKDTDFTENVVVHS